MNETTEARQAIKDAYITHIATGTALLAAWRLSLSDEREDQLAMFEAKKLRLALLISVPLDKVRPVVNVMMVDAAGGMQTLDTITLEPTGGGSDTVN